MTTVAAAPGRLSYEIASLLGSDLIVVIGHLFHFDFVAIVLAGIFIGRSLGWALSKGMLYGGPLPLTIVLCLAWGALIGFGLHLLIQTFEPGLVAKLFGDGASAYVSIPNFGLFAQGSIPPAGEDRQSLIEVVPFIAFVVTSAVLYFV